jgi:hypothetical protein
MTKLGVLGTIAGAAILTAVPLSLQWSHTNVGLSLDSAEAQERPLTATSVAGVSRRAYRRAYRSAAYARAAGYGSGLYSGYGCPAYSSYWVPYGTSSSAPFGIYASSYAIACERLKSGYAAPYGPIFY